MFCGYFGKDPVYNLSDAMKCDRDLFTRYFHGMLDRGVYVAPSQFEAGFISSAHSEEDIDKTIAAAAESMQHIRD